MASKINLNKDASNKKAIIVASLSFIALVCSIVAFAIGVDYEIDDKGATLAGSAVGIILDLFVAWPFSLLSLAPAFKMIKAANHEAKEGRERPKLAYILGIVAVVCIALALTLLIINLASSCN
ncbi:MAG: hypothetical protein IJC07_03155 [Clostridia bacterium]|nr:hypothetical protein [Clostridia bacterium]